MADEGLVRGDDVAADVDEFKRCDPDPEPAAADADAPATDVDTDTTDTDTAGAGPLFDMFIC